MGIRYFAVDFQNTLIRAASVDETRGKGKLLNYQEMPRPEDPLAMKQALEELLKKTGISSKSRIVVGLHDSVFVRNLTFPFAESKKVEPLIQYELADQIPLDVEEAVFSHAGIERTPTGSRVIAAAAARERVGEILSLFRGLSREVYRVVFSPARAAVVVPKEAKAVLVVDLGATKTELSCIRDGKLMAARVLVGGLENIVDSLATYSGHPKESVRTWLSQSGSVAPPHPNEEGFEEVLRKAVNQQLEDWRRFVMATERMLGERIEMLFVTGEGASLHGLIPWCADYFDLPAQEDLAPCEGATHKTSAMIALALMGAAPRQSVIDFRSGEFARDAAYSLVKEKLLSVTLGLSLFFASLVVAGYFTHKRLYREEKDLLGVVGVLSKEVLGKRSYVPYSIRRKIKKRKKKSKKGSLSEAPIPSMSAYVLLSEISKNLPPRKELKKPEKGENEPGEEKKKPKEGEPTSESKGKRKPKKSASPLRSGKKEEKGSPIALDVTEIRIKPGKVKLSGTVERAKDLDSIVTSLKKIKCFEEIKPGKMKTVGSGQEERQQFSLEISMTCL